MGNDTALPYWQVNIPENERTEECPEYLRNLSDKDKGIISTPDEEYHATTWPEVRKLIADNELGKFQRVPSDLRRYRKYTWQLINLHGSVMDFVLNSRLQWVEPLKPKGKPFEFDDDMKILWNDWPYGIDKRIVHLVVWTKFNIEEDPNTGDLTDKARAEINAFVQKTFGEKVPKDHIIWFKNWASLKSVHAVEHFHVMLFDPDPEFIKEITNRDIPLSQKVQ